MVKSILSLASVAVFAALMASCVHKSGQQSASQANRKPNANNEALIRYDYNEGELTAVCDLAINSFKESITKWQSQYQGKATDPEALLKFEDTLANFGDAMSPLTFMGSVSTSEKIRNESSQCEERFGVIVNDIFTNKAYYQILKGLKFTTPDEARLLKETLVSFEMNGMNLSDETLVKFKALLDQLSKLSVQFGQNLNNDVSTVLFSEGELKGAKPDFMARLKKDPAGLYIVTTKTPDYMHIMENAVLSETRKKMLFAYNNRQAQTNTPILQEATKLRAEVGQMMGYPTFADYQLRQKMAGNSKTVFAFLKSLKGKLASKNKSDLKILAKFKEESLHDSSPVEVWDIVYLANQLKIQKYDVDEDVVREYFPAQYVVDQTLNVYSQILGVDFRRIKDAPVWATQVDLYEITDHQSKEVIAYFYADLIPREGKYGHAAAFPLISGRKLIYGDGSYQKPVASIVANFTPAAPGKPVLLSHDEVETFFHEFGHIMHQTLTRAKYGSLSGSSVKNDFVEAPSQMLENWVWQKEILLKMSQHYQDPNKKLPEDLIARMQKLRMFNVGIQYTRQLVYGIFDMNIHTNPKVDVTKEFEKVYLELTGLKPIDGQHFPASFGHMMGGYSAGYYGYLWSKVYAEDMFSVFQKRGILNPALGLKYRKVILESGNMRDPQELIKEFLGRRPNNRAFFESLGL